MFELNLIRDNIHIFEQRKKIQYYFRLFYMVCALLFVGLIVRSVIVSITIAGHKRNLAEMREGIERDKKRYEIDKVEKVWRGFYKQASLIRDTAEKKSSWSDKLQELVSLVPQGVCVQEMILPATAPDRLTIRLAVVPSSKQGFETANEIITTLEKEKFAAPGVKLDSQEKLKVGERNVELFRIQVPLKS